MYTDINNQPIQVADVAVKNLKPGDIILHKEWGTNRMHVIGEMAYHDLSGIVATREDGKLAVIGGFPTRVYIKR